MSSLQRLFGLLGAALVLVLNPSAHATHGSPQLPTSGVYATFQVGAETFHAAPCQSLLPPVSSAREEGHMHPRLRAVLAGISLIVGGLELATPRSAQSLPLFARDLKVPCTNCHMAFPRLNEFGMQFKQNGYRMEGVAGTSPWEKESFPLSLIGNVGAHWIRTESGGPARVKSTASGFAQNWVEFHTAGTLAPKV